MGTPTLFFTMSLASFISFLSRVTPILLPVVIERVVREVIGVGLRRDFFLIKLRQGHSRGGSFLVPDFQVLR